MQWGKQATASTSDLRDSFDDVSLHFGVYFNTRILAAVRLIMADRPADLPSGRYFPKAFDGSGRVAEISKAMVDPVARQCGLFTALLLECKARAYANGIADLFISVVDTDRIRRFLNVEGFQEIGTPFHFEDQTISVQDQAILLWNRFNTVESIETISTRQDHILSKAQSTLEPRVDS
ncbi:hypothetical protein RMSM_01448 [Rhodopirellula maiorica SM1]|uniref:N-acyl amino acid synthase FeeM catalytic core domain-containing protein n=2 Tax=Novipirellula TaxID=2795426 RepID=M5RQX3_9BACT|nr:hypothetical protein RMSM_01448 [Rhodopirellula maiorica SM1]